MISISFLGFTFDFIGKLVIAYSLYRIHSNLSKEKRIDASVLRTLKKEQHVATLGIFLIMVGYLLQIPSKLL